MKTLLHIRLWCTVATLLASAACLTAKLPDEILTRAKMAEKALKDGDTTVAISIYKKLRDQYPDEPSLVLRLGEIYDKQNSGTLALKCFSDFVGKVPKDKVPQNILLRIDSLKLNPKVYDEIAAESETTVPNPLAEFHFTAENQPTDSTPQARETSTVPNSPRGLKVEPGASSFEKFDQDATNLEALPPSQSSENSDILEPAQTLPDMTPSPSRVQSHISDNSLPLQMIRDTKTTESAVLAVRNDRPLTILSVSSQNAKTGKSQSCILKQGEERILVLDEGKTKIKVALTTQTYPPNTEIISDSNYDINNGIQYMIYATDKGFRSTGKPVPSP